MHESHDMDELLTRVLDDSADGKDLQLFGEWVRHDENKVYFEDFKKIWNLSSGIQCDDRVVEEGWQEYMQFISSSRGRRSSRLIRVAMKYAAVILVLAVPVYWIMNAGQGSEETVVAVEYTDIAIEEAEGVTLVLAGGKAVKVSDTIEKEIHDEESGVRIMQEAGKGLVYEPSVSQVAGEEVMNEVIVPRGERISIILSDGTRVWLNSESAIRYPVPFGEDIRVVTVKGNVYFVVEKDAKRPFVVVTRDLVTEVLGTSFEVNTYGDHDEVSMTLVEGMVQVSAGGSRVVAHPDEKVTYSLMSKKMSTEKVDASRAVAWKDGLLVMKNEAFSDVILKLERWFGVSIENRSTRGEDLLFSGVFERGNMVMALETVCANLNMNYTINGKQITLND